jgi:hypothetical protein
VSTPSDCRRMTIQSLADVERYLGTHLIGRVDDDDAFVLEKCVAVVRAASELEEAERELRGRSDDRRASLLDAAVRARGTSEEVERLPVRF